MTATDSTLRQPRAERWRIVAALATLRNVWTSPSEDLPAHALAMLQQVTGVLFVAILIARLTTLGRRRGS
jgi:hypothetical protein